MWAQSHTDWRIINILGGGVERLKEDLDRALQIFPDYKFITKESGPLHTEQHCSSLLAY